MKIHALSRFCTGIPLIFSFHTSYATTVTYDVQNISGSTWEYTYAVANDTLSVDIEEFTVFFDITLYQNLVTTSTPPDWDPIAIEPDPLIPDDGFYDALALVTGIAPNGSLGGFSVQFDYLGTGTPGSQAFDIVDPSIFATIDSGFTQVVPIPAAVYLFGSGLLSLAGVGIYRRCKQIA